MNREPRISKTVAEESDPVTTRQMVCRKYNVMRFEAYSLAIVGALALTRHRYAINKIAQTEKDGGGGGESFSSKHRANRSMKVLDSVSGNFAKCCETLITLCRIIQ